MFGKILRSIVERAWLRIGLAAGLLIVGLAPVGAPILSDNAVRQALGVAATPAPAPAYVYRYSNQPDGTAQIQRSPAGSVKWSNVAAIPEAVRELAPVSGKGHKLVYARTDSTVWRSEDAGASWAKTADLPSKPLALAVGQDSDLLLAGTADSGLLASYDHGTSWRPAGNEVTVNGPGTMAVTAVSFNPNDEQIVYVAADFTMATPQGSHTAHEALVSVDSASHWFVLQPTTASAGPASAVAGTASQLLPVANRPLAVTVADGTVSQTFALPSTDVVLQGLESSDPGTRAAAAKALGLSHDPAAVTALIGHLRDADQAVGDQAAASLGRLGDPSAIGDLRMALSDQDESVRGRSGYALGLLKDEASVPQLSNMLLHDGPLARTRAADGLAAIGTPAAISALMAPLADADMTPARQVAMQAIEDLGRPAVPQLLAGLQSSEPALRRNSAEMLGWVRNDGAVPSLAAALSDSDAGVRGQAAWALGEIGTVPAQQALARALPAASDQATRQATTQALARAQQISNERESIAETPLAAAMRALTQVPASRWTFLGLVTVLAAALLVFSPRQLAKRTA